LEFIILFDSKLRLFTCLEKAVKENLAESE